MRAANIDIVYVGGYHGQAAAIAVELRKQSMKTVLMSGDALMTGEYLQAAGDAAEGSLMTYAPDPRKDQRIASVVAAFRDEGIEPEGYVLPTYAAVELWAEAARKAGSLEFADVVKALDEGTFNTVLGDVSFDAKGDSSLPGYVFYVWHDGRYDYARM